MKKEEKKILICFRSNFQKSRDFIKAKNILITAFPRYLEDLKIRFEMKEELYDLDKANQIINKLNLKWNVASCKSEKLVFYLVNSKTAKEKVYKIDFFKSNINDLNSLGEETTKIARFRIDITETITELELET